jgi:hypothetical protein
MTSVPLPPPPPSLPPGGAPVAFAFEVAHKVRALLLLLESLSALLLRAHRAAASFVGRAHWTFSLLLVVLALSLVFLAASQPRRRRVEAHEA